MTGGVPPPEVMTIGHSTRSLDELLGMLGAFDVSTLVDVRRFPASRRHPHFNGPALARSLAERGMAYVHEPDMGGRRDPRPDSPNRGWRVAAFRGYADHTATPAFQAALDRLLTLAAAGRPALMCAEAVPWRCHRQLIADAVVARGAAVRHILGPGQARAHALDPGARIDAGGRLTYPGRGQEPLFRPG